MNTTCIQNSPQQSISENSDTHLIILKQAAATACSKGWAPTWRPEGAQPIHPVSPHQPGESIPSPSLLAMNTGSSLAPSKQFTNWWCGYNCLNSVVCQGGNSSTTQPSEELCSAWRLWQRKKAAVGIASNHGYGVRSWPNTNCVDGDTDNGMMLSCEISSYSWRQKARPDCLWWMFG